MGVGGADDCDGIMRLHVWQVFLMLSMSDVIPGLKTEASALIMDETACNTVRTSPRSVGGITIRSLYTMIPSVVCRSFLN